MLASAARPRPHHRLFYLASFFFNYIPLLLLLRCLLFDQKRLCHSGLPGWPHSGRNAVACPLPVLLDVFSLLDCALCSTSLLPQLILPPPRSSLRPSSPWICYANSRQFSPSFHLSTERTSQSPFSSLAAPPLPTSTIPRTPHTNPTTTTNSKSQRTTANSASSHSAER